MFNTAITSGFTFGVELEFTYPHSISELRVVVDEAVTGARTPDMPGDHHVSASTGWRNSDGGHWDVKTDATCGMEVASPKLTWADVPVLKAVMKRIYETGGRVNRSCGLHVTVSAAGFGDDECTELLKMWLAHEDAIFAVVSASRQDNQWTQKHQPSLGITPSVDGTADPAVIADLRSRVHTTLRELDRSGPARFGNRLGKYSGINTRNFGGASKRIEFRLHNGTFRFAELMIFVRMIDRLMARAARGRTGLTVDSITGLLASSQTHRWKQVERLLATRADRRTDEVRNLRANMRTLAKRRNPSFFNVPIRRCVRVAQAVAETA